MSKEERSKDNLQELIVRFEESLSGDLQLFFSEEEFEKLIEHYESLFEIEKAIKAADAAIATFSYSGLFYIKLAQLLLLVKNINEARNIYEKALIYEPSSTEIKLLESDILVAEGNYEDAIEVLESLYDNVSQSEKADLFLEIADVHEQRKDEVACLNAVKKCLHARPDHEEGLNRYWNTIEDIKGYEGAVIFLQELLDKKPYNYLAWNILGNAFDELGLHEKAVDCYDFTTAINESYYYVYWDKASSYESLRKWDKAKEVYIEMSQRFNAEPQYSIEIGRCEMKLGNYASARNYFTACLEELTSTNPIANVLYYIGRTYELEKNSEQALRYYKRAVQQRSVRSKFWVGLARMQHQRELFMDAAGSCIKALSLNEKKIKAWLLLAKCYHTLEMNDMVTYVMKQAVETLPKNIDLKYIRSAYLIKYGHTQEGLLQLDESLTLEPSLKSSIFALFPELEKRKEVIQLLQRY